MTETETAYAKAVGRVLTEAKEKAGLSFEDLSQMSGLSRPHVTRIFYGTIDVRVADLRRLAGVLEVDPYKVLQDASKSAAK